MPQRGVPNNPSGANGADDTATGTTSAAGVVQRSVGATSGPNAPGLSSPKKAQRRAVKPGSNPAPTGGVPQGIMLHAPPAAPPPLSYDQQLSSVWTQIANTPGASDVVQQVAAEARNGG